MLFQDAERHKPYFAAEARKTPRLGVVNEIAKKSASFSP